MLVLSRRRNEKVIVTVPPSKTATRIEVTNVEQYRDKVRIGFTAPGEVTIHRCEIQAIIDGEVQ